MFLYFAIQVCWTLLRGYKLNGKILVGTYKLYQDVHVSNVKRTDQMSFFVYFVSPVRRTPLSLPLGLEQVLLSFFCMAFLNIFYTFLNSFVSGCTSLLIVCILLIYADQNRKSHFFLVISSCHYLFLLKF